MSKINKRRIIKNVGSSWFSLSTDVAVGIFLSPFILHRLGDTAFGVWILIFSITGYYGPDGNVSIPGTINALSVTSIGANAFYEDLGLANVTIPGSVTNIGDYAEWPLDKA